MKRLLTALSLLLVMAVLVPMTAFAAAENDGAEISAVVTVDGDAYEPQGTPSVEELGDFDSYKILSGEETILEIEMSDSADAAVTTGEGDILNPDPDIEDFVDPEPSVTESSVSYYSARFALPDTAKEVFLTGLTAEKADEIRERLIASFATSSVFDLEDLSFIDAEKTRTEEDEDEEMCWAATVSNMLTYTGWAAQAGFSDTDALFEQFINDFEDKGSNQYYGIGWFFNGTKYVSVKYPTAAAAAANTGGYLNEYAFDQVSGSDYHFSSEYSDDTVKTMAKLRRHLDDGDAIALSLSMYYLSSGGYTGSDHSVTCWGYVIDTSRRETDPLYNAGLFLTDSDSDWSPGDRRDAPNTLHAVSLDYNSNTLEYSFVMSDYYTAVICEFVYLKPCSDTLPKETSDKATRSKVTTPDIFLGKAHLGTDFSGDLTLLEKIPSDTAFYYTPVMDNMADVTFSGRVKIGIELTNSEGNTVLTRNSSANLTIGPLGRSSFTKSIRRDQGLPAGDYTFSFCVNVDEAVTEAYYYNNSFSYDFKVRDSYLVGDANGDGAVDILDATTIQRLLADYAVNAADGYQERAVFDGGEESDITFATMIQRWLVEYAVAYPIGETTLYNEIY